MRPLTLELEGFTAFRERTVLDLSQLDLFAITGPTGAGKSSLIDAIAYALYGRVPRVANEVSACISQGLDRMQVTLEFLAGNDRYRVYRETRRKGSGNIRLERCVEGTWEPLADRARDANDAVERIVGLSFDAFTRSVLLPQGQFQEFLAGSPDKRRDVLRSLLRLEVYERVRARAAGLAAEARSLVDQREAELREHFAEATQENLTQRRQDLKTVGAEAARLASELGALVKALDLAARLAAARNDLDARRREEAETRASLDSAQRIVDEGDSQIEALGSEKAAVGERLAANTYDDDLFAALREAANSAADLQKVERDLAATSAAVKQLGDEVKGGIEASAEVRRIHETAVAGLEAAEAALREAERHDLASALQAGLKKGDTCPVCGGRVGDLAAVSAEGLDDARSRLSASRAREASARAAVSDLEKRAAVVATKLDDGRARQAELQRRQAELAARLADALPEAEDRSLAVVQAALAEQREVRAERQRLQTEDAGLAKAIAEKERLRIEARRDLDLLGARLAAASGGAAAAVAGVESLTAALVAGAEENAWPEVVEAARAGKEVLVDLRRREEFAQTEHTNALIESGRLTATIENLERDIERAKAVREELAGAKADLDVAADLAQMLRADKFQAYVQSEALRVLAADGSRKLEQLSSGRYRLAVADGGQDFAVIDQWNADDQRSVKTLSGGETFLASLALALALAESLPGLAASRRVVLDSIFLDEGFGSLDPEALDRAADALDSLRDGSRMVCVVTHLQDLALRLPARIVVDKRQTGSTASIV